MMAANFTSTQIIERLEVLRRKLEDEGRYVGADTAVLAAEALKAAEKLAYDLKYAAAGGEDVPGSAHAVTVADVDRWRRDAEGRAKLADANTKAPHP